MLARESFQLLYQLTILTHLVPMPAPPGDKHGRYNRRPLHHPLAEDLLSPKRLWQQINCRPHAALQASDDSAAALPNTAARLPAAHAIGSASGSKFQMRTGSDSASARYGPTFFIEAPPPVSQTAAGCRCRRCISMNCNVRPSWRTSSSSVPA